MTSREEDDILRKREVGKFRKVFDDQPSIGNPALVGWKQSRHCLGNIACFGRLVNWISFVFTFFLLLELRRCFGFGEDLWGFGFPFGFYNFAEFVDKFLPHVVQFSNCGVRVFERPIPYLQFGEFLVYIFDSLSKDIGCCQFFGGSSAVLRANPFPFPVLPVAYPILKIPIGLSR